MRDGLVVLVCGGRDYCDLSRVEKELDTLGAGPAKIKKIVNGGAKGADCLSTYYAAMRGIECRVYEADWEKYGKSAGHMRNAQMLASEEIDLVVAFPGGKGTADMVKRASAAGVALMMCT